MTDDSRVEVIASGDGLSSYRADVQEVLRVKSELKEEWGDLTEFSPIQVVRRWIVFVAIVEVGYDSSWEYYGAELRTREYIAELCRRLPKGPATYFEESVALWDERFRAATTEQSEPFVPPGKTGAAAWWCYRAPRIWQDHDV